MTARSLLNGLPAKNLRSAIKHNNKLMIVICILQALGIPVITAAFVVDLWREVMIEKQQYHINVDMGLYAIIACIILGIAVIIGLVAAIGVFRELWKKQDVDMMYALPLTGKQRFFSHYLAGAIMYLVPYLVAVLIGWIILLAGTAPLDFDYLSTTPGEFWAELVKFYLLGTLGLGLLMWLYYTTTALITTCCGTASESVYTTLLLNCLVPGVFAAVLAVLCDNVTALSFEYLWQPIGYTSPIGGLIYLIFLLEGGSESWSSYEITATQATDHGLIPAFIRWAIIITILTVVSLVAAWKLYCHRKAESVSKPFVYLGAYYLMLTVLTILLLCLIDPMDAFGPVIFFAAVIYFLMEVIRKRGFRRFWMSAISYVVTVALAIGMFALCVTTDAFGTAHRIPAMSSISSVRIELNAYNSYREEYSLEYTDEEVIRSVRELHKEIAGDVKQYGNTVHEINEAMRELDFQHLYYSTTTEIAGEMPEAITVEENSVLNTIDDSRYYLSDPEKELLLKYQEDWDYFDPDMIEEKHLYEYARTYDLELTYYTHMGTTLHRSYEINPDQYKKVLEIIWGTELYAEAASNRMLEMLKDTMVKYDKNRLEHYLPDYLPMTLTHDTDFDVFEKHIDMYGGEAALEALAECYRRDLLNMRNGEQMTAGVYGVLNGAFTIWNSCTETIAMLEEYGCAPFTVEEKFAFDEFQKSYGEQSMQIRIYAPGDYAFPTTDTKTMLESNAPQVYVRPEGAAYEDVFFPTSNIDNKEYFPELYALLEVLEPNYMSEQACYLVVINGRWYALPYDKSDLAEAVINLPEDYNESVYEEIFTNELY